FYSKQGFKGFVEHEATQIEFLRNHKTYTQALTENGYNCGLAGKWHLGASTKKQAGFNSWNAVVRGASWYMHPEVIIDGKVKLLDEYITNYISNQAIDFIDQQNDDEPFYLSVHFTAPHSPWDKDDHPIEIWNSYDDCEFKQFKSQPCHRNQKPTAPLPNEHLSSIEILRGYYTAITAMDKQIGRIINKLKESKLDKNTIIIYTSDNGMNIGQHGVYGKGNGTYPLNFYEESIKVPFIYYDPRNKKEALIDKTLVSQYDLFPTLMDVCGINYIFDKSYPGQSFSSILNGGSIVERPLVIFEEYGPNRMIRTNDYKLITRYMDGNDELYDLQNDPNEEKDLLLNENNNDVANELKKELEAWFNQFVCEAKDGRFCTAVGLGQYAEFDRPSQPFIQYRKDN
ncbi:MAG: sulfatase, partial [Erysipelotrichaceae bacterium]